MWKARIPSLKGADFIKKENEIHTKIISDPDINASGDLAKRVAHQLHLYEANCGTSPSTSEMIKIKETVQNNTQHLATDIKNPAQREIRDLAIDRCLEKLCSSLDGCERRDEGKSFEKAMAIEAEEISKQKELEIVQKQVLEQQKTMEKEISIGPSR